MISIDTTSLAITMSTLSLVNNTNSALFSIL